MYIKCDFMPNESGILDGENGRGEMKMKRNCGRKNNLKMCLCEMRRSVLSAVFPHVGPVRRVGMRERKRVLCGERFTRIVVDERVNFWPNCPLSPITRGSAA
jgi:hypothetical protein